MHRRLAISLTACLAVAASAMAVDRQKAQHLDSFTWTSNPAWFGGFSALEMSPDGGHMTVLSDRATIVTASIVRSDTGIEAIQIQTANKIRSSKNKILKGRVGDSEGLVIAPDGSLFISFEGVARVAKHSSPDGRATVLPRPTAFDQMAVNGSFEPLAMDQRGWLYTMPESGLTADGNIPVYRWNGKNWSAPFKLPKRGGFLPVGADFGPDGRLYLLERDTGVFGFRSRLRRWDVSKVGIRNEETLFQTSAGTHDNLEGVSVWRDAQGSLRASMISDDNFLVLQRTELVEYALPD